MSNSLYIPDFGDLLSVAECRGQNSEAPDLWNGLVGWWPLQEGGGATAHDVAGYANHGTLTDMAPASDWIMGRHGWALEFSGSDDYITMSSPPMSTCVQSISAWFYTTDVDWNVAYLIDSYNTATNGDGVSLFLAEAANNTLSWTVKQSWNGGQADSGALTANQWYHAVGVCDGTSNLLYMDGVLSDSAAAPATLSGYTPGDVHIGNHLSVISRPVDGPLFSLTWWDRALTQSEVSRLYADPWSMGRLRPRVFAVSGAAPPAGLDIPIAMHHYKLLAGA